MKRHIPLIATGLIMIFATASIAFRPLPRTTRADRDFKIADREYKTLIKNHGESPEGWPEENRLKVCKQINLAIFYNDRALASEAYFRQPQVKSQITTLQKYSSTLGCDPKD